MLPRLFLISLIGCFLLLGHATTVRPQTEPEPDENISSPPTIIKIAVEGNRRTKTHVILREMKTQVGDTLDVQTLQADQKRIFNLALFNRVEIRPVFHPEGLELVVAVSERLYFFPYPIFFINERDWKKISVGAGVIHSNFRGRREILTVYGWAGYNPAISVDYSNPWLFGPANLLTRVGFFANRFRNRSFDIQSQEVNEQRIGGTWSIGRRFGLFTYFTINLGYMELKFDPPVPGQTLDPSGQDKLPSLGFNFIYDARDLFEFPLSGVYTMLWAKRTGFRSEYIHYFRYGADLRVYKKISSHLSLAGRVMADLHDDDLPIYDHVFLGYSNRVRGHFYSKKEGENLALTSLELRWPILPVRYFSFEDMPMFGPYMQHLQFGMSLGFFADYGRVWSPDKQKNLPVSEQFGYGAGLNLHLPFVSILRLEWAFNEDGKGEGIIDLRVSF